MLQSGSIRRRSAFILALERHKIIFLLRWTKYVQDCLQMMAAVCAGQRQSPGRLRWGLRGNYGVALRGWGGWLAAAVAF